MKKMLVLLAFAVLAVSAGIIVVKNMDKSSNSPSPTAQPPPSSLSPATPQAPPTSPVSPAVAGSNDQVKLSPKLKDALAAAIQVNASLTAVQLQSSAALRRTMVRTVVPERRLAFQKVYAYTGEVLAREWGYPTVSDAMVRAGFYSVTKMYKVVRLKAKTATISLYCFTHFRTAQDWASNQEHWDPSITTVQMRLVKGQWLFVGTLNPASEQSPVPITGLTFEQEQQQFIPYLKGFHVVSNTG